MHRQSSTILAPRAAVGNGAASNGSIALGSDLPSSYADPFDRPSKGRRSGVILHPTSLPGDYGIGELGQQAINFINWLEEAGCGIWQVLPLVPPDKYGSPYSSTGVYARGGGGFKQTSTCTLTPHTDALCGNTLLIAIDELVSEGLLDESDKPAKMPVDEVDFVAVAKIKEPLLTKAADRLLQEPKFKYLKEQMTQFRCVVCGPVCGVGWWGVHWCVHTPLTQIHHPSYTSSLLHIIPPTHHPSYTSSLLHIIPLTKTHHPSHKNTSHPTSHRADNAWIEDSAVFDVLSGLPEHDELCWWEWDTPLRQRDPEALQGVREQYDQRIERFIAKQFLFDRQWKVVKVCMWCMMYGGVGV